MRAGHYAVWTTAVPVVPVTVTNLWGGAAAFQITRDLAIDLDSLPIPDNCILVGAEIEAQNSAGAASLYFRLYRDAARDHYYVGEGPTVWTTGITTAALLTSRFSFYHPYARSADSGAAGSTYMGIRTNAGTVDIVGVRLFWIDKSQ